MKEFTNKDYTKAIRVLESTTDIVDIALYMDIILHSLYVCRNQCAEDDEFKITPEEAEKLMKSAKPMVIKSCPYLLPCGCCEKHDGLLCSQYKRNSIEQNF